MSDTIKHECGIALLRLKKPFSYYMEKYGSHDYAVNKMRLLMEKQRNRGQNGAGVANIKIGVKPGARYISRYRSVKTYPISDIFQKIRKKFKKALKENPEAFSNDNWLKEYLAFTGEVWLGHLRYGTHGKNTLENCHPTLRQNNWRSRNLVMAGNFNMTNVDALFDILIKLGQHPKEKADTVTIMEKIGHFLDVETQEIFDKHKSKHNNQKITELIEDELDVGKILKNACPDFDGGYVIAGIIGNGASFVARDPAGIRPAYYYADDEVVVVASEKPAIKTVFNIQYDEIKEVQPGSALIIDKQGNIKEAAFIEKLEQKSCSFERIYFSRGSDPNIYQERKMLGRLLVPQVLKSIDSEKLVDLKLKNTVFSYIPNTAEISFLGMMGGFEDHLINRIMEVVIDKKYSAEPLRDFLSFRLRVEKLVIKDAKLRTFIADDTGRGSLVTNIYDTTYEVINKNEDTLVIVDDSIVRGTTLERSILNMLDKLEPKKIIIASSAPQVRYPDCYGMDMSKLGEFVAFRAAIALLKDTGQEYIKDKVYHKCLASENTLDAPNYVKEIYAPFTEEELSNKITEIITPSDIKAEVQIVYQTVKNLHKACPNHLGDWYFTGNFPTRGGNRVVNKAFINYMKNNQVRAY